MQHGLPFEGNTYYSIKFPSLQGVNGGVIQESPREHHLSFYWHACSAHLYGGWLRERFWLTNLILWMTELSKILYLQCKL
jgi:hypothetical protein